MAWMTDLASVWCSMFAYSGHAIEIRHFAQTHRLTPLIEAGWLVPTLSRHAVLCRACDEAHMVDVEVIDQEIRGICLRTGEMFPTSDQGTQHRVDGEAFARALSSALRMDEEARSVRGLKNVWKLGARLLNETRVVFFLTPALGRIDLANTILEAIAVQARSAAFCLIVAGDIDAVQLIQRKGTVVRLQDTASIDNAGTISIDGNRLLVAIFPDIQKPRRGGNPGRKRERILQLLHDTANKNLVIDLSNVSLREWGLRYEQRFNEKRPAPDTIRKAIEIWNARRGS